MKTCFFQRMLASPARLLVFALLVPTIFAIYLCLINYNNKPLQSYTNYDYYPLLRKTGFSLSELLKLDGVEDIFRLLSGGDTNGRMNYVTTPVETQLAENAIKDLIDRSELIEFKKSSDGGEWLSYGSNDPSLKKQLIESLHLESDLNIWPIGSPNLLYDRQVKLHPSGLGIIWTIGNKNKIYIHDSMRKLPSWCDVGVNASFVDTLENTIVVQPVSSDLKSPDSGTDFGGKNDATLPEVASENQDDLDETNVNHE